MSEFKPSNIGNRECAREEAASIAKALGEDWEPEVWGSQKEVFASAVHRAGDMRVHATGTEGRRTYCATLTMSSNEDIEHPTWVSTQLHFTAQGAYEELELKVVKDLILVGRQFGLICIPSVETAQAQGTITHITMHAEDASVHIESPQVAFNGVPIENAKILQGSIGKKVHIVATPMELLSTTKATALVGRFLAWRAE